MTGFEYFAQYLDYYCERTAIGLFNEPLNLFSNLGFMIASFLISKEAKKQQIDTKSVRTLCFMMFIVGVGSALFHSYATRWGMMADVIPIAVFVCTFFFCFMNDVVGLNWVGILIGFAWFIIMSILFSKNVDPLTVNGSQDYFGTFVALVVISLFQKSRKTASSKFYLLASLCFLISLLCRGFDQMICPMFPYGTHFIWHLGNSFTIYFVMRGYLKDVSCKRLM